MHEQLLISALKKGGDWSSTHWTEFANYNKVVYPFTTGIIFPGFTFCLFAVMKWLQTTISEILNARETDTKTVPPCLHLVKGIQILESWKSFLVLRILGLGIRNPSSTGIESGIQCLESRYPRSWIQNPRHKTTVLDYLTWGNLCDCVLLSRPLQLFLRWQLKSVKVLEIECTRFEIVEIIGQFYITIKSLICFDFVQDKRFCFQLSEKNGKYKLVTLSEYALILCRYLELADKKVGFSKIV